MRDVAEVVARLRETLQAMEPLIERLSEDLVDFWGRMKPPENQDPAMMTEALRSLREGLADWVERMGGGGGR